MGGHSPLASQLISGEEIQTVTLSLSRHLWHTRWTVSKKQKKISFSIEPTIYIVLITVFTFLRKAHIKTDYLDLSYIL